MCIAFAVFGAWAFFTVSSEWWHYVLALFGTASVCIASYVYWIDSDTLPSERNGVFATALALAATVTVLNSGAKSFLTTVLGTVVGLSDAPRGATATILAVVVFIGLAFLINFALCLRSLTQLVDVNLDTIEAVMRKVVDERLRSVQDRDTG